MWSPNREFDLEVPLTTRLVCQEGGFRVRNSKTLNRIYNNAYHECQKSKILYFDRMTAIQNHVVWKGL